MLDEKIDLVRRLQHIEIDINALRKRLTSYNSGHASEAMQKISGAIEDLTRIEVRREDTTLT